MPVCIDAQVITTVDGPRSVLTPVDPQQSCPYVAFTSAEGQQLLNAQPTANPFALSVEDGALVSGAVAGVWCMAWAIRAIRSVLDGPED